MIQPTKEVQAYYEKLHTLTDPKEREQLEAEFEAKLQKEDKKHKG